mgnify:CR=1 FL=1
MVPKPFPPFPFQEYTEHGPSWTMSQKYLLSDPCSNDSTFKINMHSLTKAFGTIHIYHNNRYSLNDYHAPFSSNDLCSGEKYVAVDLLDQSFLETHHIVDILSQMFEI